MNHQVFNYLQKEHINNNYFIMNEELGHVERPYKDQTQNNSLKGCKENVNIQEILTTKHTSPLSQITNARNLGKGQEKKSPKKKKQYNLLVNLSERLRQDVYFYNNKVYNMLYVYLDEKKITPVDDDGKNPWDFSYLYQNPKEPSGFMCLKIFIYQDIVKVLDSVKALTRHQKDWFLVKSSELLNWTTQFNIKLQNSLDFINKICQMEQVDEEKINRQHQYFLKEIQICADIIIPISQKIREQIHKHYYQLDTNSK